MGNAAVNGNRRRRQEQQDDFQHGSAECKKWRDLKYELWNQTAVSEIRDEIITMVKNLDPKDEIKIIICGGTAAGKSSLINTAIAAIRGVYAVFAQHGHTRNQVTTWYKQHYTLMEEKGQLKQLPLSFADTRGFSESTKHGASVAAIQACIMGQVSDEDEIDPEETDTKWRERDPKTTRASFIFFVADAMLVPENGELNRLESMRLTYENLKLIKEFSYGEKIGVAAFLTNCDTLDAAVISDASYLYYSTLIEKKVVDFSKLIDIPTYRTYPIMNYTKTTNVTDKRAMQALIPLKDCLDDIRTKIKPDL